MKITDARQLLPDGIIQNPVNDRWLSSAGDSEGFFLQGLVPGLGQYADGQ